MKCPKCKKQIPENVMKCPHCSARVGVICKSCNSYNYVYNKNCTNCGSELIKICPNCKSANLTSSVKCRKCGHDLLRKEQIQYDADFQTQQNAKDYLVKSLNDKNVKLISLSGQSGIGKNLVLRFTINELRSKKFVWLLGKCSPITQLSPCGYFQDVLLTFFNVNNFCQDTFQLKKDSHRFFQQEFPSLSNDEIFDLLNFLYPTNECYYEDLFINKEKTLSLLEKVFVTIANNGKVVFVVDNFDYIDGMSYEFINKLLNNTTITQHCKFIVLYSEPKPIQGCIYHPSFNDNAYVNISIATFNQTQMENLLKQYSIKIPNQIQKAIFKLAGGNPSNLEQVINLYQDCRREGLPFEIPSSMDFVISKRLHLLKHSTSTLHFLLASAAILGCKFNSVILQKLVDTSKFETLIQQLVQLNFIAPISDFIYEFKCVELWKQILDIVKNDENYNLINEKIFTILEPYKLSTNAILALVSQNMEQNVSALNYWTDTVKQASYIGDVNLYMIAQKQCLNIIEKMETTDCSLIQKNIQVRLAKVLTTTNPEAAISYLPTAINNSRKLGLNIEEIELTAYLASCCKKLGNYFGLVECVDEVINKLDKSTHELEIAMLKSRKLEALLNIGNSGQMINIIDNEIMPVLEKYLSNPKLIKNIAPESIYQTWVSIHPILAMALVYQGDCRAFDVISATFDMMERNNITDAAYICRMKLVQAFANTIKGDIRSSEKILEEILIEYKMNVMDDYMVSKWNLINIINRFLTKNFENINTELFQVVTFANNIHDNFTKNILKTFLGKLIKENNQAKKAVEIYSEQITYFAKEKIALGALLTWYFIAEATLITEGPKQALKIAQQALDVAQNPKINNFYFNAMYNKLLGEIYLTMSDFNSAKMYIERAILIAKKYDLQDLQVRLYLLYGKYLQDIATTTSSSKEGYADSAMQMYKKAKLMIAGLGNDRLAADIDKATAVLNSFCQLNRIRLD